MRRRLILFSELLAVLPQQESDQSNRLLLMVCTNILLKTGELCQLVIKILTICYFSEESESEEDEKKNISSEAESAEESNNSSSNDDESVKMGRAPSSSNEPLTRSLRNGKELARAKSRSPRPEKKNIAVARKDTDKSSKSNSPDNRRVGTRSAHRLTKSPLREIPMYKDNEPNKNLKLDKKRNKKSTKTDGKVSNNNKETVKSDKKKDDKGEKANNSNGTTSKKMDK